MPRQLQRRNSPRAARRLCSRLRRRTLKAHYAGAKIFPIKQLPVPKTPQTELPSLRTGSTDVEWSNARNTMRVQAATQKPRDKCHAMALLFRTDHVGWQSVIDAARIPGTRTHTNEARPIWQPETINLWFFYNN